MFTKFSREKKIHFKTLKNTGLILTICLILTNLG